MSIKIELKGYQDLLADIEAAGGSMIGAAESAVRQSAQIMQTELKAEMKNSGVPQELVNSMPQFDIEKLGNRVSARVGYKKGAYDPKNPSNGYKVVFLNYGTPHRMKHGKIVEGSTTKAGTLKLGFIDRAKTRARPKIKKQQKIALEKILERLK